jgi:hypothetical protein
MTGWPMTGWPTPDRLAPMTGWPLLGRLTGWPVTGWPDRLAHDRLAREQSGRDRLAPDAIAHTTSLTVSASPDQITAPRSSVENLSYCRGHLLGLLEFLPCGAILPRLVGHDDGFRVARCVRLRKVRRAASRRAQGRFIPAPPAHTSGTAPRRASHGAPVAAIARMRLAVIHLPAHDFHNV